jgi:hypothetical protein
MPDGLAWAPTTWLCHGGPPCDAPLHDQILLLALGGLAALLSVGMFVYGSWLWIIQTNGDR